MALRGAVRDLPELDGMVERLKQRMNHEEEPTDHESESQHNPAVSTLETQILQLISQHQLAEQAAEQARLELRDVQAVNQELNSNIEALNMTLAALRVRVR